MLSNQIPVKISVVVPFYNEEENIDALFQRLLAVLEALNTSYESFASMMVVVTILSKISWNIINFTHKLKWLIYPVILAKILPCQQELITVKGWQ